MKRQGWRIFAAACVAWAGISACVASEINDAEASMLVTGTVTIRADGSVERYALDHADKLPPEVDAVVQRNVPGWKFTLAAPGDAPVEETMSLRIVARVVDKDHATVRVAGASFGKRDASDLQPIERSAPIYPRKAIEKRMAAAVYLLVKVDRSGKAADAVAEQVNLLTYTAPMDRERFRKLFADSAIAATRAWTWRVPSKGEHANDPYWLVRVPVTYRIFQGARGPMDPPYGQWEAYLPGPRQPAPWADVDVKLAGTADAVADDQVQPLTDGVRLLTPLGEG